MSHVPRPSIRRSIRVGAALALASALVPGVAPAADTRVEVAGATAEPRGLAVDPAGNGVYQPNETVVVMPTWGNIGGAPLALTGTLANHAGPAGPAYSILDAAADYGSVAAGAQVSCGSTANCYTVSNAAATRPATHWDTTVVETLSPAAAPPKTWTIHVGNSFTDVTPANPFYRFVETLLHRGVTTGCTATTFCPASSVSRGQMAVFLLVAKEGPAYLPPACVSGSERFADVPASSPFCRWVEELTARGVVAGCSKTNYCPTNPINREQNAVFLLKTLDPALNPPPCVPPNIYDDVPETSPFCRWVEEIHRRGFVGTCGGTSFCPTLLVSRETMSVLLTVPFGLTLYGVD